MKYLITVTQQHIDEGQTNDPHSCPVAIAASEALDKRVLVGTEVLSIENVPILLPSPEEVMNFIKEFDATGKGIPFTFELELP